MKKEQKALIVFAAFVALAILVLFVTWRQRQQEKPAAPERPTASADATNTTVIVQKETVVETVQLEITTEMVAECLNDVGFLVTQEYDFTQVETYVKEKSVLHFLTTESSFVYSYDGTVSAGIDFSKIRVEKNDYDKELRIIIPKAVIYQTNIDFDSFLVYSEKESIWNKLTLSDYNESLKTFETDATNRAIEKGVLEKAQTNAKVVIANLVEGILENSDYSIAYVWED